MTIQDLGSIGELIAAIATLATLVYLAAQVRQNTRALRPSTFQAISAEMAPNVTPIVTHPEVSELMLKGLGGMDGLAPSERIRFQALLVGSFRRMEAVYGHAQIGALDADLARGFELSMLSLLHGPGAAEWWKTGKVTFNRSFTDHVDAWLAANPTPTTPTHPSMGFSLE